MFEGIQVPADQVLLGEAEAFAEGNSPDGVIKVFPNPFFQWKEFQILGKVVLLVGFEACSSAGIMNMTVKEKGV